MISVGNQQTEEMKKITSLKVKLSNLSEKFDEKCFEIRSIKKILKNEITERKRLEVQVQKGKYLLLYTRYLNDIIYRFITN